MPGAGSPAGGMQALVAGEGGWRGSFTAAGASDRPGTSIWACGPDPDRGCAVRESGGAGQANVPLLAQSAACSNRLQGRLPGEGHGPPATPRRIFGNAEMTVRVLHHSIAGHG